MALDKTSAWTIRNQIPNVTFINFAHRKVTLKKIIDETLALANGELEKFLLRAGQSDRRWTFAVTQTRHGVVFQGDVLAFSAPDAIGVLYLVYDFAEKALGFCFFEPGQDRFNADLVVPLEDGWTLTPSKPLLKRRGLIQEFPFSEESFALADWMAKNKLNYLLVWMKYYDEASPELKEYFQVRGVEIESGHHNFDYWIPLKKYSKTNLEFFAVIDGKRVGYGEEDDALLLSKQLCVTNPDVRREIVKNMIDYVKRNPEIKTLSLVPNDGFGWCECESCSKFHDPSQKGEFHNVSEHVHKADRIYHDLFKEVAAQLRQALPDVTLTFSAYVNYSAPSAGFALESNAAVHFAPYWRCVNHAIGDPDCPINSGYVNDLKRWEDAKRGGEINVYEYLMGVNLYVSLPLVFHERIFDEIQWFADHGVDGYLTQFHVPHWSVYGMNYHAMAKAAAGEDGETILKRLFQSLFGSDAKLAEAFYKAMADLVAGAGNCHVPYPRSLLRRTRLADYEGVLELAEKLRAAAPNDPFRSDLVVWADYLLHFKKLFDKHHAEGVTPEEIDQFRSWIHQFSETRVFVLRVVDKFLDAWKTAVESGKEWLHFNIDWEDEHIRKQEERLT